MVLAPAVTAADGDRLDEVIVVMAELVALGVPRRKAAELVSRLAGVPRNELYRRSL